ncbi:MFS transporter [Bacteroides ovatus]|nr:MFS transporter [Bacteroides ovatus]
MCRGVRAPLGDVSHQGSRTSMSIAGFALWIGTYLIGQLTPWMLQNLTPAGTFFLFALMCVPYMLIVWKLVPETTGKSLEEIERYWTRSE